MATKKTESKATLTKIDAVTQLDGSAASEVVVEARLTKMELAEYLTTAAQEAFDAELVSAESAITSFRWVTLKSTELIASQRKALIAYRAVYGSGEAHLRVATREHGPLVWVGPPDRSGAVWDLPVTEAQKSHPIHEQYARALKTLRAIHERRENFNPGVAKMQVIETMLGTTENGRTVLTQLKGMVNRAVRGE